MNPALLPIVFYSVAAVLLVAAAIFFFRKPSRGRSSRGWHERQRKRKALGLVLIVGAAISFGNGWITQFYGGLQTSDDPTSPQRPSPAAPAPHPIKPATATSVDNEVATPPSPPQMPLMVQQAESLIVQNQPDAALERLNLYLHNKPDDVDALALRGEIYVGKTQWEPAEKDFRAASALDASRVKIRFDLAEAEFVQNKYDAARADFAPLIHDIESGDVATYKVYLCDLYGGHEDVATTELAAINQVQTNASYYFANAAACLFNKKNEEARTWLTSADHVFSPNKFMLYATSLAGRGTVDDLVAKAATAP